MPSRFPRRSRTPLEELTGITATAPLDALDRRSGAKIGAFAYVRPMYEKTGES